ncbi:hypothetical protein LPB136_00870 [Tenacibaculum todarodis]|uniref:Lipoprotein n=1 Tax=Tenacibaculum todarodis TaxID=1850252 RepID=A0A1L3JFU8_9FLAO|nr:hypothetical protein [Tenacibaculum todarodis]APG64007.1 hypothetical protein LPB136_00870 [Tenacibaculum todarodis]
MKKIILLLIITSLTISCSNLTGKEVARLKINKVSTKGNVFSEETTLSLKKGDEIAIWSDMDYEYKGNVKLRFKVKIFIGKTKISEIEIDPTNKNITVDEVKTALMGKTKWRFTGKNYKLNIKKDESYTFKSILIATKNPDLKITKAELVLKK